MTDDDPRRTRAFGTLAVFRFARSGFSQPVSCVTASSARRNPPFGRDLPAVAIAKHMAAGENIDGLNPSGETPHPRAPLGAAGGENGNVPLE